MITNEFQGAPREHPGTANVQHSPPPAPESHKSPPHLRGTNFPLEEELGWKLILWGRGAPHRAEGGGDGHIILGTLQVTGSGPGPQASSGENLGQEKVGPAGGVKARAWQTAPNRWHLHSLDFPVTPKGLPSSPPAHLQTPEWGPQLTDPCRGPRLAEE